MTLTFLHGHYYRKHGHTVALMTKVVSALIDCDSSTLPEGHAEN